MPRGRALVCVKTQYSLSGDQVPICPIRSKKWNKKKRNETQPTLSTKTTVTHWAQTKGPGTWRGKALQPEQWLLSCLLLKAQHLCFQSQQGRAIMKSKKMLTAGRHHKDRSRQTSQMKKSKARRGQVTCPRYLYQGQKQDKKDSSEHTEKGRDSLKIDWESHSHSTSKNKRRIFFLKAKKWGFIL